MRCASHDLTLGCFCHEIRMAVLYLPPPSVSTTNKQVYGRAPAISVFICLCAAATALKQTRLIFICFLYSTPLCAGETEYSCKKNSAASLEHKNYWHRIPSRHIPFFRGEEKSINKIFPRWRPEIHNSEAFGLKDTLSFRFIIALWSPLEMSSPSKRLPVCHIYFSTTTTSRTSPYEYYLYMNLP